MKLPFLLAGALACGTILAQDPLDALSPKSKAKAPSTGTRGPVISRAPVGATAWSTFNSPSGYRIQHPAGWKFQDSVDARTKLPVIRGQGADARLSVVIAPVFENARTTAQGWLNANLTRQLGAYFPRAARARVAQASGAQAIATLEFATQAGAGRASVLCFLNRGTGMVFAVSAPSNEFAARRAELVRILKSFQFTKAATAPNRASAARPAAPAVQWRNWSDPTEGAASLQVPAGWRVEGGVSRQFSTVAPVLAVRMTSPDGRITLGINDHNVPPYSMPGPYVPEGQWYTPGYGTKMFVMRFLPGMQYAQFYAQNFLTRGSAVAVRDQRDRAELVAYQNRLNAGYASTGADVRSTAGEVSFEFNRNGQPNAGYVMAITEMMAMAGTGTWNAKAIYFFAAPREQAAQAGAMLAHAIRSIKVNPQWFYSNLKMVGDVSKIVAETNDYISKLQSESYWSRQRSQDRTNRNFDDYIRGVQRVRDPETGEEYEARAGYNYYYVVRGDDKPFGTDDTDTPRYIDVTPLEKVD